MSYRDEIRQLIKPLVAPVRLRWGYQDAPAPPLPYINIHIGANRPIGRPELGDVDEHGIRRITAWREASVQLQSYAKTEDECEQVLHDALLRLSGDEHLDRADAVGISVTGIGPVQLIPEPNISTSGTTYQPRGIVEINMTWVQQITDDVGLIERVEGLASINNSPSVPWAAFITNTESK